MIGAQAVADGPPASRAPHTPCGSADLPQVHADRDRGARDDDVAAVVARRQSPRFIANSSQGAAKDCALSLTWSGRAAENAGLLKRQHRSRSQRAISRRRPCRKRRLSAHVTRWRVSRRRSSYRTPSRRSTSAAGTRAPLRPLPRASRGVSVWWKAAIGREPVDPHFVPLPDLSSIRHQHQPGITFQPFHSITSSARSNIVCGIVSPSAWAVLRLITSSNFVGCSTGRSDGFAPLRILTT